MARFFPKVSLIIAGSRWPSDVDIWHVGIPSELPDAEFVECHLNDNEKLRAARFRRDEDRLRFAVARASLRALLADKTGKPASALRFISGRYGKPALDGHPQIQFNVTHSGQHALIAVSEDRRVGVDIEVMHSTFRWRDILDFVCTPTEQQAIVSMPEDLQTQMFFRCWTAKEALVKATGLGIAKGLTGIKLDPLSPGGQWLCEQPEYGERPATLHFHWLTEIAGCTACMACEI
jgi:4'-phosphopantetheinyl transferase